MKRGNDEEKIMGPMFPRLHVNDTEKGGPRAPPRNKMALYEQLSIPSQRFSHGVLPFNPNNTAANLVHPSSLGGGNDRGKFFAQQIRPRNPSEKQYSQYSELSTPLTQVEQRKKLDDDDYRVPIFIHSRPAEFDKYSNNINQEKLSPSNPPYLHPPSRLQKAKETGVLEHSMQQEGKNRNGENSNELVAGWKQTVSLLSHEPGDNLANGIDRLRNDDSGELEICAESQLSNDTAKRNSSNSLKALPSEDQNTVPDLSNDTASHEDESCMPPETGNLERGDSVSETSILDTVSCPDITPDDVVGIIGQKHFWKARRAIANQQRIFAVQVFELHRLIKVQRLIAASPNLLLEDNAYFGKPVKPLSGKKRPLDYAGKTTLNASKGKIDSENPSHKKEGSAENTVEKASLPSAQNALLPSTCKPSTGGPPAPSIIGSDHNVRTTCFNDPQTHQWLIPVMSPTEGLVYKPYPGTGFLGQACGGCGPLGSNPMIGNLLTPTYGVPAPPPQYPFPSFPAFGPHGYFSPYGMPIMTTSAFSGSSVEQTNPQPIPGRFSAGEATSVVPTQSNLAVPDGLNSRAAEEIEVQASTTSCPSKRRASSQASSGRRNMLPLFPTSPAVDTSTTRPQLSAPGRLSRVIKVVPHDGISASESAARIFRSIQEERNQNDSV